MQERNRSAKKLRPTLLITSKSTEMTAEWDQYYSQQNCMITEALASPHKGPAESQQTSTRFRKVLAKIAPYNSGPLQREWLGHQV